MDNDFVRKMKCRIYPTHEQELMFEKYLRADCALYNFYIEHALLSMKMTRSNRLLSYQYLGKHINLMNPGHEVSVALMVDSLIETQKKLDIVEASLNDTWDALHKTVEDNYQQAMQFYNSNYGIKKKDIGAYIRNSPKSNVDTKAIEDKYPQIKSLRVPIDHEIRKRIEQLTEEKNEIKKNLNQFQEIKYLTSETVSDYFKNQSWMITKEPTKKVKGQKKIKREVTQWYMALKKAYEDDFDSRVTEEELKGTHPYIPCVEYRQRKDRQGNVLGQSSTDVEGVLQSWSTIAIHEKILPQECSKGLRAKALQDAMTSLKNWWSGAASKPNFRKESDGFEMTQADYKIKHDGVKDKKNRKTFKGVSGILSSNLLKPNTELPIKGIRLDWGGRQVIRYSEEYQYGRCYIHRDEAGRWWALISVKLATVKPDDPSGYDPESVVSIDFGAKNSGDNIVVATCGKGQGGVRIEFDPAPKKKIMEIEREIAVLDRQIAILKDNKVSHNKGWGENNSETVRKLQNQRRKLFIKRNNIVKNRNDVISYRIAANHGTILKDDVSFKGWSSGVAGKGISRWSPAQCADMIEAKAKDFGRDLRKSPVSNSSRVCKCCGYFDDTKDKQSRPDRDTFLCPSCGNKVDSDENSAEARRLLFLKILPVHTSNPAPASLSDFEKVE